MTQFKLNKTWQVLGPFPIGSREQDFGADPLENYGGFSQLKYSTAAEFSSELVEGGLVGWTTVSTDDTHRIGPLDFANARWKSNETPFGWSIEQYQAWARGLLVVYEPVQLFIQISGVSEFYIGGIKYHGDYYAYNTTAHIIYLERGKHSIDVRMVHDVRVFGGGKIPPQCQFQVYIYCRGDETLVYPEDYVVIKPALPTSSSTISKEKQAVCELLMPDYLKDIGFAGSYGSVTVQNAGDDVLWVTSVTLCIVDEHTLESRTRNGLFMEYKTSLLMNKELLYLLPGQTRPVGFHFQKEFGTLPATEILRFWVRISFAIKNSSDNKQTLDQCNEFAVRATSNVRCIDWIDSAFQYTFLDYDRTVQYAMAKRPQSLTVSTSKPVIVALHGAGVEADSDFWINSVPSQKHSWTIYPTGRTPWGYDWHGPSAKNVFSALQGLADLREYLPPHIECVEAVIGDWVNVSTPHETLKTLKPSDQREWTVGNIERLIVIGHSNGGQGVWYFATHFPDKIIAAVPAAGYTKIQDYISYANWVSHSYCDPQLKGVLESAIAEFNNDLYLSNMTNISVLPRLGTEDDNVPPLHTRKYVRVLNGLSKDPTAIRTSEVPNTGHWWDTVFSDRAVQDFLAKNQKMKDKPEAKEFTLTLTNPAGSESIHGIKVEQLCIPFRLGKVDGSYSIDQQGRAMLTLKTTNISSFRFTKHFPGCHKLKVDGDKFLHLEKYHTENEDVHITYDKKAERWKLEPCKSSDRNARTYGPVHRMYESQIPLVIVIPSIGIYEHAALQISHDWYLYGRGDSVIVYENDDSTFNNLKNAGLHYRIYLGLVHENAKTKELLSKAASNISIKENTDSTISIRVADRHFREAGTGILCMQPGLLEGEIAIVISGTDTAGFNSALQLIPKRTGIMTPEWIVTNSGEMKATGLGGVLAAGYFDNEWRAFGYV